MGASKTSTTMGSTLAVRNASALVVERVVPTTWCPASSSRGTRRLPTAPAAPAKKIFMTYPCLKRPTTVCGHHRSVSAWVWIVGGGPRDQGQRKRHGAETDADQADERPHRLHPRNPGHRRTDCPAEKKPGRGKARSAACAPAGG